MARITPVQREIVERFVAAVGAEKRAEDELHRARETARVALLELDEARIPSHVWAPAAARVLLATGGDGHTLERIRVRFRKRALRSRGTPVPKK